jgi:hypothetical protein
MSKLCTNEVDVGEVDCWRHCVLTRLLHAIEVMCMQHCALTTLLHSKFLSNNVDAVEDAR